MKYKVVPISKAAADGVRESMVSPHGNLPTFSSVATGYGPCRSCLKTFRQEEEQRIYISYDPFAGVSNLPLPGPVFIHGESCSQYAEDGFPTELLSIPLLLEGFGTNSRLVVIEKLDPKSVDDQVRHLLDIDGVEFIHVRNGEAGCFIAKVVRT